MTTPDNAIRARRKLTNKLIAAHDAARLRPFFVANAKVIVGDGGLILGADAIVGAFTAQFAEPDFQTFVREPVDVSLDSAGDRAAETGRWIGRWTGREMGGTYLAAWQRITGQWFLDSELYVTLRG